MNKSLIFISLIGCVVLQVVTARVVRDAPITPPTFTELAKQAEDAIGILHTKFLEFVGAKNDQDLTTLVETQGKTYATKLQDLVKQLGEEAKSNAGKADELFKNLQTQLTSTVNEMRSKNPELFADADKFQAKFQESLKTVLKDTEQFNTKLKEEGKTISTNVEQVLKQIYDNTLETAKKVTNEIETVIKENKGKA